MWHDGGLKRVFVRIYSPQSRGERRAFGFFCFSLRRRKTKRLNPSSNKMPVLANCDQRIDTFCRFRSASCLVLFHYRPLNGNGKTIILCVLCASSEAGGEYKLTYLHSKAGPSHWLKGLMD
jgi:hypothetical protein